MTAPLNAPKDTASARKRRRRAPAGGAADDCFTCTKRNVKCDRRRPYCSQCLEIGNECSGYKTQLTWGVGVASRGKLRGLSLPVAKAPPVTTPKKPLVKSPSRPSPVAIPAPWTDLQDERAASHEDVDLSPDHPTPSQQTPAQIHHPASFTGYDISHIPSPDHASALSQQSPWAAVSFPTAVPASDGQHFLSRPLHHLSIPTTASDMLSTSIDSMSDVDYTSPLNHSYPRDDIPFLHSPSFLYDRYHPHGSPASQTPVSAIMMDPPRPSTSCPSLVYGPSEPSPSLQSQVDSYDAQMSRKLLQDCDGLISGGDLYSSSSQPHNPFWPPSIADEEAATTQSIPQHSPVLWPSAFQQQQHQQQQQQQRALPVSAELIARMPFFMDYYENTMCPSMVLIDGLSNPFRDHILRLAVSSRSLQHAICALAACNLRMKRRLSLGQHGRDLGEKRPDLASLDSSADPQPGDQSLSEEYQHRNLAVQLLNEQLNEAEKSGHDSVLATILLLCHYRMAESGIAKFQTQFAGVRKILAMRRSSLFQASGEAAWMEAIFTYLDAVTASINDREPQICSSLYGALPDPQLLPPGVENLIGCDRELFRTVYRLGRLNLLSQRHVHGLSSSTLSPAAAPRTHPPPLDSPLGPYRPNNHAHHHHSAHPGATDFRAFPPRSNGRFDGNGFGGPLDDEAIFSASLQSPGTYEDPGSVFWRELKEVRSALQSWEFDSQRVTGGLLPTSSASAAPTGSSSRPASVVNAALIRDLGSLSEAFRYAALLYTERLASPNMRSTHSNFRNLVTQVVYYATSLESGSSAEKFLLWPLFVAGSECVNELQQNIVRSKCRDIVARSGYMNNMTALEVLERLWAGDAREESAAAKMPGSMRRGPFNWTKYIGGAGLELEWIMF